VIPPCILGGESSQPRKVKKFYKNKTFPIASPKRCIDERILLFPHANVSVLVLHTRFPSHGVEDLHGPTST
jgi:hypothetical protein